MGRYTSLLFYSDKNTKVIPNNPSTSSGPSTDKKLATEKVYNVLGSCAGAGSGEFDKYRLAKRREQLRLEAIDQEALKAAEDEVLQAKLEQNQREADERTRKNAEKRKKKKMKKLMKRQKLNNGNGHDSNSDEGDEDGCSDNDGEEEHQPKEDVKQSTENSVTANPDNKKPVN